MKSRFLSKTGKKALLAIPAAALMLGASQAGVVGIHYTEFWGPYAANGTGVYGAGDYGTGAAYFSYGYMTTGFNVTATAFGVPAANWTGIQVSYAGNINVTNIVGGMTVISTAGDAECSGIGNTNFVVADYYSWFVPAGVTPGNDQVTWAYLDDDTKIPAPYNTLNYTMWNVQLSGMKAAHPSGYTIQTISYPWIFDANSTPQVPDVNISDLATFTNKLAYTDLGARQGAWGVDISHAALSTVSPVMTADVVNLFGDPPWIPTQYLGMGKNEQRVHSTLCGFIITDAAATAPLTLQVVGNNLVWSAGTLQSATNAGKNAVFTTVTNATSPYPFLPSSAPAMFYRLKQ